MKPASKEEFTITLKDSFSSQELDFCKVSYGEASLFWPASYWSEGPSYSFYPLKEASLILSHYAVWRLEKEGELCPLSQNTYEGKNRRQIWTELPGGQEEALLKWYGNYQLSPDTRYLAFTTNRDCLWGLFSGTGAERKTYPSAASLWLLDLATREEKPLLQSQGEAIKPYFWLNEETILCSKRAIDSNGLESEIFYQVTTAGESKELHGIKKESFSKEYTAYLKKDTLEVLTQEESSACLTLLRFDAAAGKFVKQWRTEMGDVEFSLLLPNPDKTLMVTIITDQEKPGQKKLVFLSLANGKILSESKLPSFRITGEREEEVYYFPFWLNNSSLFLREFPLTDPAEGEDPARLWFCRLTPEEKEK